MIAAENLISLSQYLPKADSSDEPYLLGKEAARSCCHALADELAALGYSRESVIDGLAAALSALVSVTFEQDIGTSR